MKKRIVLLLACCMIGATLVGCGKTSKSEDVAALEIAGFEPVPGMDGVVYNVETRVMFYMFNTSSTSGYQGFGYSYFGQYINENGRGCWYINNQVEEIVLEDTEK